MFGLGCIVATIGRGQTFDWSLSRQTWRLVGHDRRCVRPRTWTRETRRKGRAGGGREGGGPDVVKNDEKAGGRSGSAEGTEGTLADQAGCRVAAA